MRRFALLFALALTATLGAGAASAAVGPLSLATGASPFAPGCSGAPQTGTNYLNAEVEPWVEANPLNPRNLIAVWQQDRWSNGGANGLLTGVSENGGRTWTRPTPPGFTTCAGGTAANGGDYERASDPWVSFSPNGDAYQISLSFNDSNTTNAVLVSKSENNGRTWGPVTTLIKDTNPQFFNDKESITADPTDSRSAYAVWDRLDQVPNDPNAPFFRPRDVLAHNRWRADMVQAEDHLRPGRQQPDDRQPDRRATRRHADRRVRPDQPGRALGGDHPLHRQGRDLV